METKLPQTEVIELGEEAVPETGAQRISYVDQLRMLWEKRRFLFTFFVIGLAGSVLLAFLLPSRFESTTRLMPPDNQSSSGAAVLAALSGAAGGLGLLGADLAGFKGSGALFVGILKSGAVQEGVVSRFDLKSIYGTPLMEVARKRLAENTAIFEDRKSGIITITVVDRDPVRAQGIAQGYVQELDRVLAEVATSAARREREFIEQRLSSVKQELDQAAQEFSQFASKNVAIDIKEQARAMVGAAATLQGQLIAAQSELEGLRQIYTDNNPRVRSLQARLTELKRQLARLGGTEGGSARSSESQDSKTPYPSIRELPVLGVTYGDLFRKTKVLEVVYETLTQQYELAKVQEAKEIPVVRVLDPANVPERRSGPSRRNVVAMSVALSLLFGVAWVLAAARWEATDPEDPRKKLMQEVLYDLRTASQRVSGNGTGIESMPRKVWFRLRRTENGSDLDDRKHGG